MDYAESVTETEYKDAVNIKFEKEENESKKQDDLLTTIENLLSITGYKILDGDNSSIIIRNPSKDIDYEIKIEELIPQISDFYEVCLYE